MEECDEKQQTMCNGAFKVVHQRLDVFSADIKSLLISLNGNGKPGIKTRLDRLEQMRILKSKFAWLAIGSVSTAVIGCVVKILFLG